VEKEPVLDTRQPRRDARDAHGRYMSNDRAIPPEP
jgi:hypothetical protein